MNFVVGCLQCGNNFTLGWITFRRKGRKRRLLQPTKEAYEALLGTLLEIEPPQSRAGDIGDPQRL